MNSDVLMSSDDVAIFFAALVIGGLALAALISTPVLELPDDDYPQGPFRHSSDDVGPLHHPAAYDEDTRC